eukprot:7279495-Pyramimonas_sp.AAC.1
MGSTVSTSRRSDVPECLASVNNLFVRRAQRTCPECNVSFLCRLVPSAHDCMALRRRARGGMQKEGRATQMEYREREIAHMAAARLQIELARWAAAGALERAEERARLAVAGRTQRAHAMKGMARRLEASGAAER